MSLLSFAYKFARPLLFNMDAEKAHNFAIACLKKGLGPKEGNDYGPSLRSTVCGIDFPNPIGLAAGFDKNAEVIGEVLGFGFGFVELGSITPKPQPGNPKPRLFRVPSSKAIINRFGFNSDGMEQCQQRFMAYRDAHIDPKKKIIRGVIGINLGKNKNSVDAAADYVTGVRRFAPFADYLTINISSPNTPGLRDLQSRDALEGLLNQVMTTRNAATYKPPVFVKIAPDLTETQMDDIAAAVLASGVDGVIVGNTTITRPGNIPARLANEAGGLSGKPLFDLSTRILAGMYKRLQGRVPLIGCGGVSSAEDAFAKICAGASLVQLYSALVYEGPDLIPRINRELEALLMHGNFASISEAVGSGNK